MVPFRLVGNLFHIYFFKEFLLSSDILVIKNLSNFSPFKQKISFTIRKCFIAHSLQIAQNCLFVCWFLLKQEAEEECRREGRLFILVYYLPYNHKLIYLNPFVREDPPQRFTTFIVLFCPTAIARSTGELQTMQGCLPDALQKVFTAW